MARDQTHVFLLVKGDRYTAAAAAAARDIPFAFRHETARRETLGRTSPEHLPAVVAWFCENPDGKPPFLPGTLLYYNTHNREP